MESPAQEIQRAYEAPAAISTESYIPEKDGSYVPFGNFGNLRKVITNHSIDLHHSFLETARRSPLRKLCLERELIRVNITSKRTNDLIGGFRLVNGGTVWHNGPVIGSGAGNCCF